MVPFMQNQTLKYRKQELLNSANQKTEVIIFLFKKFVFFSFYQSPKLRTKVRTFPDIMNAFCITYIYVFFKCGKPLSNNRYVCLVFIYFQDWHWITSMTFIYLGLAIVTVGEVVIFMNISVTACWLFIWSA